MTERHRRDDQDDLEDEEHDLATNDDRVYEALRTAGGTLEHLVRSTGLSKLKIDTALRRLLASGKAERKWVLVSRGAHDWKFYAAPPHANDAQQWGGAGTSHGGDW